MKNYQRFILTLTIGFAALLAEFLFKNPAIAYMIVAITGGLIAIQMLIDMIATLRSGKYGVDILAITAIVATLAVGQYWASLVVLIMLTGGDSLEDYASRQASKELQELLSHSPQLAHVIKGAEIIDCKAETVQLGELVLVKPGELVPVDGVIKEGRTTLDESSLTGESLPVEKGIGDEVMSGSLNGDQAFRFKVTKVAADSQYQLLVKLVKESAQKPANFVRLADRYAVPFTIIAYVIGGLAWFFSKDPVRFAEVLVVASPCPLILAAPIALVAGMSRSSRNGIVVKNGTTIEKLATAKSFSFDKTGTITEGALYIDQLSYTSGYTEKTFLQLVASAEQESGHVIARSIVREAKEKGVALLPVKDLEEVTGQGVVCFIEGNEVKVGKSTFVGKKDVHRLTNEVAVFVAVNGVMIGHVTMKDQVRQEAKETMQMLKAGGVESIHLLTGDKQEVADSIADQVGIDVVHADCLPQDKIAYIQEIPAPLRPTVMVGDGVNDAPALSVADIGIAMGAHGSTAASESADIVILKDDLAKVAQARDIAKRTMVVAKQSVLIGIIISCVLMVIASFGIIPTLLGAALQEVIDTVAILSALRARNDTK